MDKRTETLLDKVAEEWVIARQKLGDRDPKIKENDVEWIEAIKTIVVETNLFLKTEHINKIKYSGGRKGKHDKYSSKDGDKITEKQLDWLSKHGVDASNMTKQDAIVKIDEIIKSEEANGESAWF